MAFVIKCENSKRKKPPLILPAEKGGSKCHFWNLFKIAESIAIF